jgi:hypothetical protein
MRSILIRRLARLSLAKRLSFEREEARASSELLAKCDGALETSERRLGVLRCIVHVRAWVALALASFGSSAGPASAAPADPCSSDTFSVDGSVLLVRLCVREPPASARTGGKQHAAPPSEVAETFSAGDRTPIVRSVPCERLPNEETAHTLDDVPLQALGIDRTLHVVLAVRNGNVRLEHALLVPGALSLK